jgi:hypothetical protein
MGCCVSHDNNIEDFPYQKVEEFNNLKTEIEQVLSNKDNKDRKNFNKVLELFNKSSSKITEYERELKKLKNKKEKSPDFNHDMFKGLNDDIKQLREYNHTLNNLLKECDDNDNKFTVQYDNQMDSNEIDSRPKETEEINEDINFTENEKIDNNIIDNDGRNLRNINKNLHNEFKNDFQNEEMPQNDFQNYDIQNEYQNEFQDEDKKNELTNEEINKNNKNEDIMNNFQSEDTNSNNINNDLKNININNNNIRKEHIYYKKAIRRNKKSNIINKKTHQTTDFHQNDINSFQEMNNYNKSYNKTEDVNDFENNNIFDDNNIIDNNINDNNNNDNNNSFYNDGDFVNSNGFDNNNNDNINDFDKNNEKNDENLINIIFVLENGKKVDIQAEKNEYFLDVVKKLGEKEEEYNNLDNILLFDDNEDITEKVKNGETVSSFGFNDYHYIQVKFGSNIN